MTWSVDFGTGELGFACFGGTTSGDILGMDPLGRFVDVEASGSAFVASLLLATTAGVGIGFLSVMQLGRVEESGDAEWCKPKYWISVVLISSCNKREHPENAISCVEIRNIIVVN